MTRNLGTEQGHRQGIELLARHRPVPLLVEVVTLELVLREVQYRFPFAFVSFPFLWFEG